MDRRVPEMLAVLRANCGFAEPEKWVEYGLRHDFRPVRAETLPACPDCGGAEAHVIGQYVYYSTLARLKECRDCDLIYSDVRIDPDIIHAHFETVYKDELYFQQGKRRVFHQLAGIADSLAPHGASVLDIGGAKGHLMARLRDRRKDLTLVVNDISRRACEFAGTEYGLRTLCGDVTVLEQTRERYEVVVLSDVMYYEPELARLWSALDRLVADAGSLVIRAPNTLGLLRLHARLQRITWGHERSAMQDRIRHLNPEHLYGLSRRYLVRRLTSLGFSAVRSIPGELTVRRGGNLPSAAFFHAARMMYGLTGGTFIGTPSFVMVASRRPR